MANDDVHDNPLKSKCYSGIEPPDSRIGWSGYSKVGRTLQIHDAIPYALILKPIPSASVSI